MKKLTEYLPKEHPAKKIFRRHGIPIAAVANFLGLGTTYTCQLLNGFCRLTPENERKLAEFVRLIENEAKS